MRRLSDSPAVTGRMPPASSAEAPAGRRTGLGRTMRAAGLRRRLRASPSGSPARRSGPRKRCPGTREGGSCATRSGANMGLKLKARTSDFVETCLRVECLLPEPRAGKTEPSTAPECTHSSKGKKWRSTPTLPQPERAVFMCRKPNQIRGRICGCERVRTRAQKGGETRHHSQRGCANARGTCEKAVPFSLAMRSAKGMGSW